MMICIGPTLFNPLSCGVVMLDSWRYLTVSASYRAVLVQYSALQCKSSGVKQEGRHPGSERVITPCGGHQQPQHHHYCKNQILT